MVATTHQELRTRAIKLGIETRVIHGSSVLSAVGGELGLHSYNFGRIVDYDERAHAVHCLQHGLQKSLDRSSHDSVARVGRVKQISSLNPVLASQESVGSGKDLHNEMLTEDTFVLVVSRMGTERVGNQSHCISKRLQACDLGQTTSRSRNSW